MQASEAAFRAAEIISEKGHCKHRLEDEEGRVCYVGALLSAITETSSLERTLTTAERPLFRIVDLEVSAILLLAGWENGTVAFNNDDHTTGEDVISLFKEAGSHLEEAGS